MGGMVGALAGGAADQENILEAGWRQMEIKFMRIIRI
jgi:hypothetical protein